MEGDENIYAHLESPKGDSLFAAYEHQKEKLGKILIVARSDYLYMPRSLFCPDVILLTAPNLDCGQAVVMSKKSKKSGERGSREGNNSWMK